MSSAAGAPADEPAGAREPLRLTYELTRGQRLRAHAGMWLLHWPGLLMLAAFTGVIVALGIIVSPWFLIVLVVGLPPMSWLHRLVIGLVQPILFARLPMDLVIEDNRVGWAFGKERQWLEARDIARIERFADVWCILGTDGTGIEIPVALIDDGAIDRLRRARAGAAAQRQRRA